MSRSVIHLRSASQFDGWPDIIPRSRPRGVKALGRRYEAAVSRQLGPRAMRGLWWSYCDANGPGLCQTDFLIEGKIWAIILECKNTWTWEGMEQLTDLYLPVVEMAREKRVAGIQVCKNLIPGYIGQVFQDLEDAVAAARRGCTPVTLHWHGFGSILQHEKELVDG